MMIGTNARMKLMLLICGIAASSAYFLRGGGGSDNVGGGDMIITSMTNMGGSEEGDNTRNGPGSDKDANADFTGRVLESSDEGGDGRIAVLPAQDMAQVPDPTAEPRPETPAVYEGAAVNPDPTLEPMDNPVLQMPQVAQAPAPKPTPELLNIDGKDRTSDSDMGGSNAGNDADGNPDFTGAVPIHLGQLGDSIDNNVGGGDMIITRMTEMGGSEEEETVNYTYANADEDSAQGLPVVTIDLGQLGGSIPGLVDRGIPEGSASETEAEDEQEMAQTDPTPDPNAGDADANTDEDSTGLALFNDSALIPLGQLDINSEESANETEVENEEDMALGGGANIVNDETDAGNDRITNRGDFVNSSDANAEEAEDEQEMAQAEPAP